MSEAQAKTVRVVEVEGGQVLLQLPTMQCWVDRAMLLKMGVKSREIRVGNTWSL